jgi:hypothetical protein
MTKARSLPRRTAIMLATFAILGAVAAVYSAATASADGRTLTGDFCTFQGSMFCMTVTWDGVKYGTPNRDSLALRPGTYWLTVNDNAGGHDFALRSCPGSTIPCDQLNPLGTSDEITTRPEMDTVTVKVHLTHGTYRLFCDVGAGTPGAHEGRGMYVDFAVGGEGQVG